MVKILIFVSIFLLLFLGASHYGLGIQGEDKSSGGWKDSVIVYSTGALAFFTLLLVGVTFYYAIQTKKSVNTNKELIELNKVSNSLSKTQLLYKLKYECNDNLVGLKPEDHKLEGAIDACFRGAVVTLLGEDFRKKVRLKLKEGQPITSVFSTNFNPGQEGIVSLLEWNAYKETQRDEVERFEVIGVID